MWSPQSEADLQKLEGRKTRKRANVSVSHAFNDIRDVLEGQRENEHIVENEGDIGSDEDFLDVEKKKKRKVVKKKKVKLSKGKSSADVSSTVPTNAKPAQSESRDITVKSEHRTQQKNTSSHPTSTILQVANAYDIKIPSIVPNIDNQGTQLLYTQASMNNILPISTPTGQVAETLPSRTHNVFPGMVQAPTDMFAKIMDTESDCIQPASITSPTSPQVARSRIKNLLPSQISQKHHSQQEVQVAKGRGRGRGRGRDISLPRKLAPEALRPARPPSMVRPCPPRYSQMRPGIPGYPGVMLQHLTPRPRLSSTRPVQRVLYRPKPQPLAHSSPSVPPVQRPGLNPGLSRTGPMQRVLCTPEPQPVAHPPVVELDLENSPQYKHASTNTSTMSIPDIALPSGISITRRPPAHSTDMGNNSASNLASLAARALVRVGDSEGQKCLVLYEITESQIQGLRDLGLSERRI